MNTISILCAGLGLVFAAAASAGPVNINTADAPTLADELHGVGPVVAERIVQWRERNGAFTDAAQLTEVRGVGAKTLQRNLGEIRLD